MVDSRNFDPHDPDSMTALCQMSLDAGRLIMAHYENGVEEETKADNSPVTQADRDAEALLEQALARIAPDIQVIGEEACAEALPQKIDEVFFLLDPLDGTRDFVAKRDNFTVNIGLIENDKPIAGVIYVPAHEKLYFSGTDAAYKLSIAPDGVLDIKMATRLRTVPITEKGVKVITSYTHRDSKTDDIINRLHVTKTIATASSYKFCLLAEGEADFYPRSGRTMEWDTAAGQAILEAAGGLVTLEDGTPLSYGKLARGLDNPSFIAAASDNWQTALK